MRMKAMLLLGLLAIIAWPASVSAAPDGIEVTASDWERTNSGGFPPEKVRDGIISTASSWRAEGESVWIQFDLGQSQSVTGVLLAFFKGDGREYSFEVAVSKSGKKGEWTTVIAKGVSSGKSVGMESFRFSSTSARYVRVIGHGSTSEKFPHWFNLTEAAVFIGK